MSYHPTFLLPAIVAATTIFFVAAPAPAMAQQMTAKECNAAYTANKASIQAAGQLKKDYIAACRAGTAPTGSAATPAAAPAAAPAPTAAAKPAPTAAANGVKTARACNEEYAANRDAIQNSGQLKKDFITACRAGTETIPTAATPAKPVAPVARPAASTAPAVPAPSTAAPAARSAPTGANQYATEAQARGRCAADTVVWLNLKSKIYHYAGSHSYGTTKTGAYMCEADAKAAGERAAENEKHP